MANAQVSRRRLVCYVNGIYGEGLAGGDIYFSFMVRAALGAGWPIHFFGGHALKRYLKRQGFPLDLSLTDTGLGRLGDVGAIAGQLRLLNDFRRRFAGSLARLDRVRSSDVAYAMSDYWFDTIPLMRCRARAKILYLGMIAPTLGQVVFRRRGDVPRVRLPSLYYWMSQQLSLRWFRRVPGGILTYSHPEMRDYAHRFGYPDERLWYVPNGGDTETANRVSPQPKVFDLAWVGRVHPQKGIEDLLETLVWLRERMPDFRAVIIGQSEAVLAPIIRARGLADNVKFSGLVSEVEKFKLLKQSRVFAMPSHYESWGIVVGEALICGVPVVGYRLDCYPPVCGAAVRYVEPFDREAYKRAVEDEVRRQRADQNYLAALDMRELQHRLSWRAAQDQFVRLLARFAPSAGQPSTN